MSSKFKEKDKINKELVLATIFKKGFNASNKLATVLMFLK